MLDALISYHYYRNDSAVQKLVDTGRLNMIGDSGAFSAYTQGASISMSEYAEWVRRWRQHLFWVASLDVLGDPEASWKNWVTLHEKHGLKLVPTLHVGTPRKWLDAYAAEGVDFIGLGGGLTTGANDGIRWSAHMLAYARREHPEMRFHGWGISKRAVLDNLPFYSADSSGTLGVGYRYGRMRLFDPRTARDATFLLDGTSSFRHRRLLEGFYGTTPEQIARGTAQNRGLLIRLSAASTQYYAKWLQDRHQVTAPSYGLNPARAGRTGMRVHLVSTVEDLHQAAMGTRLHLVDTRYLADAVKEDAS